MNSDLVMANALALYAQDKLNKDVGISQERIGDISLIDIMRPYQMEYIDSVMQMRRYTLGIDPYKIEEDFANEDGIFK